MVGHKAFVFLIRHWLLVGGLCLMFLLLARNPFSERTLIPNLEPYPDSFHYIVPARSFLKGYGFVFEREGRTFRPSVPAFYSLFLALFYMVNSDPRMFYIANVLLACISYVLFYRITEKLFPHVLVQATVALLYVTNFYTTWYPQWAMAENLSMAVIFLLVYLLLLKPSRTIVLLSSLLPITLYGIKFALGPLTIAMYLVFFARYIWLWVATGKKRLTIYEPIVLFALGAIGFAVAYSLFDLVANGRNIYTTAWGIFSFYFHESYERSQAVSQGVTLPVTNFFSITYFLPNLQKHWVAINGGWTQVLWEFTPILPQWIAAISLFGLFASWITKTYRWFSLSLFTLIATEVLFMSTFYAFDTRYVMFMTPFLLWGFGMGWETLWELGGTKKLFRTIWYGAIMLLIVVYSVSQAVRLKTQISINLRHAETPWWYISTRRTITYFASNDKAASGEAKLSETKPVVISAIPSYMYDFYWHNEFELLPLSQTQDFHGHMQEAWGPNDYTNLLRLYKKYLHEGRTVFVMNYGLGNVGSMIQAYQDIQNTFNLELKQEGCYSLCNIYQLSEKVSKK